MTIVNRRTFVIKPGKLDEAVAALAKGNAWDGPYHGPRRMYTPIFADNDLLVGEYEYENFDAYEKQWAAWESSPDGQDFVTAMGPVEVRPHHNEIRELVAANALQGSEGGISVRWVRLLSRHWQPIISADVAEFITPGELPARLSLLHSGWWGECTLEIAFESLADYEARLAEWQARTTTPAYWDAVLPNLRAGGRTEVWRILQP